MQRLRFLAISAMLVLLAGTFFSGQAQKRIAPRIVKLPPPIYVNGPLAGTYVSSVDATQVSAGEQNAVTNDIYGWTLNGTTTGDLSGYIFLSVNYTWPASDGPGGIVGIVVAPPSDDVITGGSWTKLVFVGGVYQGSISGRILGGTTTWDEKTGTTAIMLDLAGDKGSDAFVGNMGSGTFVGTMDRNKDAPVISGTLTLKY